MCVGTSYIERACAFPPLFWWAMLVRVATGERNVKRKALFCTKKNKSNICENFNSHLCGRIMLVLSGLPSCSDQLSILSLSVVFSVRSLFPVCNLYFHFFLTSLGQHRQFHHLPITPQWFLCSYPFSRNEPAWEFFFFFWRLFFLDTRVATERTPPPPPSNSLSLSLRPFLPRTESVFKRSQETCSPGSPSFVVSGNAEEAVTHLLGLKEMVLSIDLQETFLPWGHALQAAVMVPHFCFSPACVIRLQTTGLWSIQAWRDVLHVCCAVFPGHYIDKTVSNIVSATAKQPFYNQFPHVLRYASWSVMAF